MPELMTALQEFSEEVQVKVFCFVVTKGHKVFSKSTFYLLPDFDLQFFEESEIRRQPEDPISCTVSAVPVTEENFIGVEAKKSSALVLQRAPIEDEDEISSSTSGIGTR